MHIRLLKKNLQSKNWRERFCRGFPVFMAATEYTNNAIYSQCVHVLQKTFIFKSNSVKKTKTEQFFLNNLLYIQWRKFVLIFLYVSMNLFWDFTADVTGFKQQPRVQALCLAGHRSELTLYFNLLYLAFISSRQALLCLYHIIM